ncbi:hypothetical protein ANN_10622 [Periplaneta americana]|uniref:Uncharacterized protein n=1 Tax=Periplaneta americana TaxID=6978 RepID=A0ABQ8T459_PERAM|nr:hypothetical protein ANN_10622 [Periplaneta americana]
MLCISKYTQSRIAYILADTTYFTEDLMATHSLVPTPQSIRFLEDRRQTATDINHRLLSTPAMTNSERKEANYHLRHLYSPWTTSPNMPYQGIPQPTDGCQCTVCGGPCDTYHIIECKERTLTLSHYANGANFT